ncbi:MAG: hypothetical protein ACLQBJ_15410 [Bryobacteraceae bacterium]
MENLSHASHAPEGPQGTAEGARGGRSRGGLFFFVALALICGTAAFIGIVPTRVFGHDNFFFLDNGWRIVNGLRPHLDFYSPWGPVTYLIVGLGMVLSNASPNAIGYGSAIVGLVTGLWAYGLGRDRLENALRIVFGLYLAVLATAPYSIGTGFVWSTHAMAYNRYGYALLGLVLLECLQRAEGGEENAGELWGGISTGAAMGVALFLKISYFVMGTPIVALSLVYRGLSRRRLGGLLLGFGVVAVALLAYLSFDIPRIVQDMRIAAGGRSRMIAHNALGLKVKLAVQVPTLLILIGLCSYGSAAKKGKGRWIAEHELAIWGLVVFVADLVLLCSNMQMRGMPIVCAFAIIVASRMVAERGRAGAAAPRSEKQRYIFVLLLCGLLSLPQLCSDLAGLAYGAKQKADPSQAASLVRFTSPRLAPVILYDYRFTPQANGGVYTAHINDGVELLKRYCGPQERVITFDMVNPFPYALGWRPARGGMAASAYNNLFSDEPRPSDDEYFGDATAVMVPKEPAIDRYYYDGYYRIYHPGLMERFRLVAESKSWWLYKRK